MPAISRQVSLESQRPCLPPIGRWMAGALLLLAACGSKGPETAAPKTGEQPTAASRAFDFIDFTEASGVDFVHDAGMTGRRYAPEQLGSGGALFDADGDGDLDLLCLNGGPLPHSPAPKANVLFLNDGQGKFRRSADLGDLAAGSDYGVGCAVADVDADGDLDVFVSNFGPDRLYLNDGQGRFRRAKNSGVEHDAWSAGAAFGDLDGDGLCDLYVTSYLDFRLEDHQPCFRGETPIYCGPQRLAGKIDRLYRNLGDGRFEDVTDRSLDLVPNGKGLGVAFNDFDADGDLDIYVANDQTPNFLYRNDGNFRFSEVGAFAGVQVSRDGASEAGMGVAFEDFDDDLLPDIAVTNFEDQVNSLYRNEGDELFEEVAWERGLGYATRADLGWGIVCADFDLDGRKDLLVANGHVYDNAEKIREDSTWKQPNRLFLGNDKGQFTIFDPEGRASAAALTKAQASRGLAVGDIDGDGDLDAVVFNLSDRVQILRNEVRADHLTIKIRGGKGAAIPGTTVVLDDGNRRRMATSSAGGSYLSASGPDLVFASTAHRESVQLEVRWTHGKKDRYTDLPRTGVLSLKSDRSLDILRLEPGKKATVIDTRKPIE